MAGYQPHYFPRLHYLARVLDADIFEISDYVQFVKKHAYVQSDGSHKRGKSHQVDAPIKSGSGVDYLTIPIHHDGLQSINEVQTMPSAQWARKHLKKVQLGYGRAPYFAPLYAQLEELLLMDHASLAALTTRSILWSLAWILGHRNVVVSELSVGVLNELLRADTGWRLKKIVLISDTGIEPAGGERDTVDWILDMCRHFGVTEYSYGGTSGAAYMALDRFAQAGVRPVLQDWTCRVYRQQFMRRGFIPNLSVIDLLANESPSVVRRVLGTPEVVWAR